MEKNKYTPEQIIRKLCDADAQLATGTATPDVCKQLGIFAPARVSGLPTKERALLALRLKRELKIVRDVVLVLGRLGGHVESHQGTRVDHLLG